MPTPAQVVVVPPTDGALEVQEVALPDPGPHHVVVQQYASGICHSQLHQIHAPRRGVPVILGHESTGVAIKVGSEVEGIEEGDTVMVTWVPKDSANMSNPPTPVEVKLADGSQAMSQGCFTWATHTIADETYVVKVAKEIKRDVTSIIGCAVITGAGAVENTAGVQKGDSVAVIGVGGVGISAIAAAKKIGANPIIAVDLREDKLEYARKFGATHTINASEVEPVKAIRELTVKTLERGMSRRPIHGADFVFDCIGIPATMSQVLPAARSGHFGNCTGGTGVLVGLPTAPLELNAMEILANEKKLIGSFGGTCSPSRDFPKYLDWYASGDLDLDSMVTERFTIDQINEAVGKLENGEIFGRSILEFDS